MKVIAPYDLTTDGGIARPSPKNVYDSTGTLVTVPAGQVAITYDPSNLDAAPWVAIDGTDVVSTTGAFVYSNLPENDAPAWSAATAYAVGDKCVRLHRVYEAQQASTNKPPETNSSGTAPAWLDLGATNQRACLDLIVGSTSSGPDRLFFVFRPGKFASALELLNIDANDVRVSMVDENGVARYQQTKDLRIKKRTFTDWFFKPVERKTSAVFEGLPFYSKGLITLTITKAGSTASVGEVLIGRTYKVGKLQWEPEIRGLRYSKITTDDFGRTTFLKRRDAKEITADVMVDNDVVEEATRVLDIYTTQPLGIYADVGSNKFGGLLTALGFVSDYRTVLKSPAGSLINIKIQGFV
ncbi:hypothetical protein NX774_12250 [Massilia agilis]|uniref:Uncharacterized protein n=1 Tax=Massilia agilis TaxID=1811226 RepID=A0ABT2DBI1_9BURK|nr:hypothetical protein [Massilia agilis]MCS0808692.1 hypothetical protein [Massilia agilis]